MSLRFILALTVAFLCCEATSAIAQFKGKEKIKGSKAPFESSRDPNESPFASAPAFLVTLEERTMSRKVFLPYREIAGQPPREPAVLTMYAVRRIQGDEPAKAFLYISGLGNREFPEEDVRKVIQFKKDFAKKVAPLAAHVEMADLTLRSHGLTLYFNLKTQECYNSGMLFPDGFFNALSDTLGDLEKLKAGKPSFQVK